MDSESYPHFVVQVIHNFSPQIIPKVWIKCNFLAIKHCINAQKCFNCFANARGGSQKGTGDEEGRTRRGRTEGDVTFFSEESNKEPVCDVKVS